MVVSDQHQLESYDYLGNGQIINCGSTKIHSGCIVLVDDDDWFDEDKEDEWLDEVDWEDEEWGDDEWEEFTTEDEDW